MLSFIPARVVENQSNSLMAPASLRREARRPGRLSHTARRVGRVAVEMVLFLGVGGAMAAGALLLR
jgi:hypothetical protein